VKQFIVGGFAAVLSSPSAHIDDDLSN